jgi:NitT/TauT family transport system permease protein
MFWISSPYLVVSRLVKWIGNGYLLPQVAATLEEGLGGFVIGVIIGGTLGILCGYFRLAGRIVEPAIVALYSLPVIALAPLFLLWFGIGQSSKVALAAVTVIFLVFFNTYAGLKNIDEELVSIVRIMGARSTQLVRTVVLPSALTSMFTGFKVALPYALIGAVVGEIISSNKGIGYLIQLASTQFDTTGVFVGLVALATVSVLLSACVRVLEARLMPWRS